MTTMPIYRYNRSMFKYNFRFKAKAKRQRAIKGQVVGVVLLSTQRRQLADELSGVLSHGSYLYIQIVEIKGYG